MLIGGLIDGGQKLQVAGTASITGEITGPTLAPGINTAGHYLSAFGASTSWATRLSTIYDTNYVDQYITLNGTLTGSRATPTFTGASTGGAFIRIDGANGNLSLGRFAGGAGAAIATTLTLDTSQNATFAKSITASGPLTLSSSTQGNANFYAISTSASANFGALYEADARTQSANARWNWGTGSTDGGAAADSFRIRERVTGVNTLVISAVTGNATFAGSLTTSAPTGGAGAWELGVYSATAPTATGYVTIEIGGVQYKLLAST